MDQGVIPVTWQVHQVPWVAALLVDDEVVDANCLTCKQGTSGSATKVRTCNEPVLLVSACDEQVIQAQYLGSVLVMSSSVLRVSTCDEQLST
jgi:hypothetical protein